MPAADRGRLGVAAIALLLAFGEHGIVGWWQQYLPLVGKFRFPCRSIVWVYAAVALLAAIAWQRLVDDALEPAGRPASSAVLWAVEFALGPGRAVDLARLCFVAGLGSSAGPLWFGAGAVALVRPSVAIAPPRRLLFCLRCSTWAAMG